MVKFSVEQPKIVVPLMAKDSDELAIAVARANQSCADIVEWRVDQFEKLDVEALNAEAKRVSELTKKPVLATLRTKSHGGLAQLSEENYLELVSCLAEHLDLVDVELSHSVSAEACEVVAEKSATSVGSTHFFDHTPPVDELLTLFDSAERIADVAKVSVFPNSERDVIHLLEAAAVFHQRATKPFIAISMDRLGQVSRVFGPRFGSCASFAVLDQASAPGQLNADDLARMWSDLGFR